MAPLQYVFVYVSSDYNFWKILLQYVFANVSLDGQFGEILPHTPCKKKVFFFSGMCCHMCLRITSLYKSCTTLLALKWLFFIMYTCIWGKYCPTLLAKKSFFLLRYVLPYVSSDDFPLPHTPCKKKYFSSLVCVAICVFRSLPFANPAPHS